jgi:DNA-directed RNA polymerase specialized sigma24 family protein
MLQPADDLFRQALAQGREEAFAALYDQFASALFGVAMNLTGSLHDAEDAVQEVFAGVVRARTRLPNVENLRAYMFTALRRAVLRRPAARP